MDTFGYSGAVFSVVLSGCLVADTVVRYTKPNEREIVGGVVAFSIFGVVPLGSGVSRGPRVLREISF